MKAVGVIPARYGSTRFPGKPLVKLLNKPLLQWVIERSRNAKKLSQIIVATDDQSIADLARQVGAEAIMTDPNLPSGSDRVWKAIEEKNIDVVLNIQGDEPLIRGEVLDQLVEVFEQDPNIEMATLGRPMTDEALVSPNTAKILLNHKQEAIYFSRFPIPYSRGTDGITQHVSLKHVGIYGYRKNFLGRFCKNGPVAIEQAEGLEQLRALYLGARIKVVFTDLDSWGVDTPEDVIKVEAKLKGI